MTVAGETIFGRRRLSAVGSRVLVRRPIKRCTGDPISSFVRRVTEVQQGEVKITILNLSLTQEILDRLDCFLRFAVGARIMWAAGVMLKLVI